MCIILAIPRGKSVPKWELRNCWDNNDDGAGLMYVRNDQIVIAKELSSFDKFYEIYTRHQDVAIEQNSPMILHFRIGTHGTKTIHNVHPFRVNKNLAFCHNGVLTKVKADKKNSDTVMYNKLWLKHLPDNFWKNYRILQLIEDHIGSSKFVFLDTDKKVIILNKTAGEVDSVTGIWYSNTSYRVSRKHGFRQQCFHGFCGDDDETMVDLRERYTRHLDSGKDVILAKANTEVVKKLMSDAFICDGCARSFKTEELKPLDSDHGSSLLCKDCYEDFQGTIAKFCMYCEQSLEEEDTVAFENGSSFCTSCAQKLGAMGVMNNVA